MNTNCLTDVVNVSVVVDGVAVTMPASITDALAKYDFVMGFYYRMGSPAWVVDENVRSATGSIDGCCATVSMELVFGACASNCTNIDLCDYLTV